MIRLTKREKLLAGTLLAFVAGWVLFAFAVKPAIERIETLNRVILEKQDQLRQLKVTSSEYIALRDNLKKLHTKVGSQQKDFKLLPFLESLIRKCGLQGSVATMKQRTAPLKQHYKQTVVEIQLENLAIDRLLKFLSEVESSKVLAKIKALHIQKNPTNKDLLDSVVEIQNIRLAQN